MIAAAPPYPDELISSAIIRCCRHHRISTKSLGRVCFRKQSWLVVTLTTHPLGGLETLFDLAAVDLVWRHTLFPYSTAFWDEDAFNDGLLRAVDGGMSVTPAKPTSRLGTRRYCDLCAKSDLTQLGESYWRRVHNLPGVWVCPHHACHLKQASGQATYGLPHECEGRPLANGRPLQCHLAVAELSQQALMRGLGPGSPRSTSEYRALAIENGWLNAAFANKKALLAAMAKTFGSRFLVESNLEGSWPALLLRPKTDIPFSPLKHIVMQTLLGKGRQAQLSHKPTGPSASAATELDPFYSSAADRVLRSLRAEQLSTEAFLRKSGCWGAYKHRKHELPLLRKVVLRFRASPNSCKQLAKGKQLFRAHPGEVVG